MANLHQFTLSDIADYQRFVDKHEHATAYHNKPWGEAVSRAYGFTPKYIALQHNRQIPAVIPCVLMTTLRVRACL